MEIKDTLLYVLPSLIAAGAIIFFLAERSFRLSRKIQSYELDRFRHDLELRIADLARQLTVSEERFRQVNHLLLDGQAAIREPRPASIPSSDFLKALDVDLSVKPDRKLVFVLMPFHPEFADVYVTIKLVVEELGFRCSRGDEEWVSGNILGHVLQELVRARLVIADITGRNPNVFYELGIAHAIGKPALLLAQAPNDIPFDVVSTRVLIYKTPVELRVALHRWLAQSLA